MADFVAERSRPKPSALGSAGDTKRLYAKLGGALAFRALPAVMHFGGYEIGRVHQQKLCIVNTSDHSQRVHIIVPSTPYFKAKYKKKGLIAPGMQEEVTVEFMPTEWRYHYDCIRLHSEKENLLVPIHAYPVMNEAVFPRRIDFGVCPLAETATRRVALECKVPIQFEFELEPSATSSSDFYIHPKKGIVPANGRVIVTIDFTPVKLTVARMPLTVKVSQFGFEPFVCEVVGSAAAGITREAAMAALHADLITAEPDSPRGQLPPPPPETTTATFPASSPQRRLGVTTSTTGSKQSLADVKARRSQRKAARREAEVLASTLQGRADKKKLTRAPRGVGSGAVHDPGYTAVEEKMKTLRQKRLRKSRQQGAQIATIHGRSPSAGLPSSPGAASSVAGPASVSPPRPVLTLPQQDSVVDGVRIPAALDGMPAANFVLTQQPGKLKPKDLAAAIAQRRAQRAAQLEAQARLRELQGGNDLADSRGPGPGLTLQAMLAEERGPEGAEELEEPSLQSPDVGAMESPSPTVQITAPGGNTVAWGFPADGTSATTPAGAGSATEMQAWDVDDEAPDEKGVVRGGADDPRRLREMVFLEDVGDIDDAERKREFQSQRQWEGEVEMTGPEVEKVMLVRVQVRNAAEATQRDKDRRTYTTRAKGPHQIPPVRATAFVGEEPVLTPRFDPYANDEWGKRTQVLRRLRGLVTKHIVRQRVDTRLAALQRLVAEAAGGGTKALRAYVEKDHRLAQTAGAKLSATRAADTTGAGAADDAAAAGTQFASSEWLNPPFQLAPDAVQRLPFPELSQESEGGGGTKLVPVSTPYDFQELTMLRAVEPPEQDVMAYSAIPVPVFPSYVPQEKARIVLGMRQGALAESAVRAGSLAGATALDKRIADADAIASVEAPAHVTQAPPVVASAKALLPDPGLRPLQPLEVDSVATSPAYVLQPQLATPFSLVAHATPVIPAAEAADGGAGDATTVASTVAAGRHGLVGRLLAGVGDAVPDLNGLVVTRGQAEAADLTSASLRALLPTKSLSQVWRPRRERVYPDYERPHPWSVPDLPSLLAGPRDEDELSDDSESDVEDTATGEGGKGAGAAWLTFEGACNLFAPPEDAGAQEGAGEGGTEGDAKEGDAAEAAAAGSGGQGSAPAAEIPRDRARLVLAAEERKRAEEAAGWLDARLKVLDAAVRDPKHRLAFDELPRVHVQVGDAKGSDTAEEGSA